MEYEKYDLQAGMAHSAEVLRPVKDRLRHMPWQIDDQRRHGNGYCIRYRYDDALITREPIVAEDEWVYFKDDRITASGRRAYVTAFSGMNMEGTYADMSTTFQIDEIFGQIRVLQTILAPDGERPEFKLYKLYDIENQIPEVKWQALHNVLSGTQRLNNPTTHLRIVC